MRKTLLLVFIHGFKGGDDTFATFPEHLRALISHALPKIDIIAVTYPRFETRGELSECVGRFREWYLVLSTILSDKLENKVIDLEAAHSTPSPIVDPSVHVILSGHSMGGIVAAETLLLLATEQPVPSKSKASNLDAPNFQSSTTLNSTSSTSKPNLPENSQFPHNLGSSGIAFMFPHVQGLLAFDTPFLGLAPSMISIGAEEHLKAATTAYSTLSEISKGFGWGTRSGESTPAASSRKVAGALPAPPSPNTDAAASPRWQSWGKYAMFAGAAGAVAAGGAAALYTQKDKLSAGWTWATSHLAFVNTLLKGEELNQRVCSVSKVGKEKGVKSANYYTRLKEKVDENGKPLERTFCALPKAAEGTIDDKEDKMRWHAAVNTKARDEIKAHMGMFRPKENPGFYILGQQARDTVVSWVDLVWYEASEEVSEEAAADAGKTHGEVGGGWDEPDYETDKIKIKSAVGQLSQPNHHNHQDLWSRHQSSAVGQDPSGEDYLEISRESKDGDPNLDDEVRMRDEILDARDNPWTTDGKRDHDLGSSVIVDRAS